MPSTARPWSDAKIAICGARKRGFSVFWIRPSRTASASSSPRLPVVSARRASKGRGANVVSLPTRSAKAATTFSQPSNEELFPLEKTGTFGSF